MGRWVFWMVAVLLVAGCGSPDSQVERQEKKEDAERVEKEAAEKPEQNVVSQENAKTCADFYGPQDSQEYLDSPNASEADRKSLDPDDDGFSCNAPGQRAQFKPEPPTTTSTPASATASASAASLSSNDQAMLELANCQLAEAQAELSPEEFASFEKELSDELVAAIEQDVDTNIQTLLYERGYDCDGRAQELGIGD